jgi:hypothetical protein
MFWPPADNDGCRFSHHCRQGMSLDLIKHGGRHKHINIYFNLKNQLNYFNGSLGTNLCKASQPSGGMDSSNHAAGGTGGSTTMVVVFIGLVVFCGWTCNLTSTLYVKN